MWNVIENENSYLSRRDCCCDCARQALVSIRPNQKVFFYGSSHLISSRSHVLTLFPRMLFILAQISSRFAIYVGKHETSFNFSKTSQTSTNIHISPLLSSSRLALCCPRTHNRAYTQLLSNFLFDTHLLRIFACSVSRLADDLWFMKKIKLIQWDTWWKRNKLRFNSNLPCSCSYIYCDAE